MLKIIKSQQKPPSNCLYCCVLRVLVFLDVNSRTRPISGQRKHQQIFHLQRRPKCTPPSIIQCYSCEECPNKTTQWRRINCTQDAKICHHVPWNQNGEGFPVGTWLNFKSKTGTNIQMPQWML